MNATIEKFGYPTTLVRDYVHWVLLVRPSQVTAGSLILAAKGDAPAYGELPTEAFTEQAVIVAELEQKLRETVNMSKINYLMLMMVDPHVHFHIFPRYQGTRSFAGVVLTDHGWPGPPDLKSAVELDSAAIGQAVESLR
ncbi:MAG: HIT family protein [Gemmatimonadaceae bacterium]|nr:HIT family protein [Gemmatimonadaceae bacterium]